jgi:polyisoprenoid-binding protein YceI
VKKTSDSKYEVTGMFEMHGVAKEITVTADVRMIPADLAKQAGLEPGEWIKISAPFEVKLSDYEVTIPDFAAAKVNDTWKVRFIAYAVAG